MTRFKLDHQFSLVVVCAVLHNIIRDLGPEDAFYEQYDQAQREHERVAAIEWAENWAVMIGDVNMDDDEVLDAEISQDQMAEAMFLDYQNHPRRHWRR